MIDENTPVGSVLKTRDMLRTRKAELEKNEQPVSEPFDQAWFDENTCDISELDE